MAIQQARESLNMTLHDSDWADQIHRVGIGYRNKYHQETGDKADLETAIQHFKQAVDMTPHNHPNGAGQLHNLGAGYHDRYRMTGDKEDLDRAIQQYEESLSTMMYDNSNYDDSHRADSLHDLGVGYRDRYGETGDKADLDRAIHQFQQAFDITLHDHPNWAHHLHTLGAGNSDRYRRIGDEADLDTAINQMEQALSVTPDKHPNQAMQLHNLGAAYRDRFQRKGDEFDLETAIQCFQQALDITPYNHPSRVDGLYSLGAGYHDKYRRLGDETDLDTAIEHYEKALDVKPFDYRTRITQIYNLGVGYHDRYERTGDEADIDRAIQKVQEAVTATPHEHHLNWAEYQHQLGLQYRDRYRSIGDKADLETAIQHFQKALHVTPHDHPDRPQRLHSLGLGYRNRYLRIGAEADLETSIQYYEEALDITPSSHVGRASRLYSLGVGYHDRYRRTGDEANLTTAAQQTLKAYDATPYDHPDRAVRLHGLGLNYRSVYERTGEEADLEIAMKRFQEALDATPKNHRMRADHLYYLGVGYNDRYQCMGDEIDLQKAVQHFQQAVDETHDHPNRAGRLHSLGASYFARHQRTKDENDLKKATQNLQDGLDHSSSQTIDRLECGQTLLLVLTTAEDWISAYQVASDTISLIPLLTPRSLENSDKQHLLADVFELAVDAAAVALHAEASPYEAVRLLELGRGVITSSVVELRADISDLEQRHPRLAHQFVSLRDQLDSHTACTNRLDEDSDGTRQIDQRYNAGRELEQTIQSIRGLPGFDRFLMAPSENEVKDAASSGPIVVINPSEYRCDAFIIEMDKVRTLPLPDLKRSDIRSRSNAINPQSFTTEILEWLWNTVAKPVLNTLGFTESHKDRWPRVSWILSGSLTRFPIHAAGYHFLGSADTVLDRVISSYSSSVKALVRSHQARAKTQAVQKPEKVVLVGMPELQHAPDEINQLERLCNAMKLQVRKPQPSQTDVLAALADCEIFHFAGHGLADPLNPLKSALLLSNEELSVSALFETNLHSRRPFLAYLSACGTGQIKRDELVDEALHLISACQLAGFQHVIGTLWEVNDKSCVAVAKATYEWMLHHNMSDASVSEGLHHASRRLRGEWMSYNSSRSCKRSTSTEGSDDPTGIEKSQPSRQAVRQPRTAELLEEPPLHWVPYVHFGD